MAEIAEAPPRPAQQMLARVLWFVVLPLLLALALLLPPVSLYERIAYAGFTALGPAGGAVTDSNGAELTVSPGALSAKAHVRLLAQESLPPDATAVFPANARPASPVYAIEVRSDVPTHGTIRLPLGAGAGPRETIDLYAWDGTRWSWVPYRFDGPAVVAELGSLPRSVALVEMGPVAPAVAASLSDGAAPAEMTDALATVSPTGWYVRDDAGIDGELTLHLTSEQAGRLSVVPVITNRVGGVARSDWVDNLLIDAESSRRHAGTMAAWAIGQGYDGIAIDYRGVDPQLRDLFTAFVRHVGDRLHVENRQLVVVLEMPAQTASGWDTGAYDWPAIGQVADRVWLLVEGDQPALAGGPTEGLLSYAVTQIDRRKIQPAFSVAARDVAGDVVTSLSYRDALSRLVEVEVAAGDPILVGETVRVDLPALAASGGIQYDDATGSYWFTYIDKAGQRHQVWLEDAGSLARKLASTDRWHLGGVVLSDVSAAGVDPRVWETVAQFAADGAAQAAASDFSVVWTVPGSSGSRRVVQPISATSLEWKAPEQPGVYQIQVALSSDGGQSTVMETQGVVSVEVQAPTPTPTPLPPTATPEPLPSADAIVEAQRLNVREGPSTNYEIIGTLAAGDELVVTGKNDKGTWLQIETDEIDEGWVFAELVEVIVDLGGVAVAEAPPEPTPAPQQQALAGVSVAPRTGAGFGYGIQAHMIGENLTPIFDAINGMGFNWVKQQVEWFRVEPAKGQYGWGLLDPIVDAANARGVSVLFSVVKAPHWARSGNTDFGVEGPPANPQDFADFMGAMAAHYRGRVRAYEIWNEQNLHYEWGNEPLDAGRYVQLLAAAYNAIKANDPGAIVVSGALTPTGVNDGVLAVDDAVYLERMYQAGLARFCDAIGAHPSGYNNPPNVSSANWSDPTASFGAKGHRSWFFYDTMVTYRNIMAKYGDTGKRIWPTEFGWASVEGLGVPPAAGYGYAADNTETEQAQFLAQAFQVARSWGWVGPMFVWNLNFGPVSGAHNEKAAFGVLKPDWGPRPAYAALRDMPK